MTLAEARNAALEEAARMVELEASVPKLTEREMFARLKQIAGHIRVLKTAAPGNGGEADDARDAAIGRILMKYIDRLMDAVPSDPLENIVEQMADEVHTAIAAWRDKP